jgi:Family of unknown function (DUF6264)
MTTPWQSPDPTELPPAPPIQEAQPVQPRYRELAPPTGQPEPDAVLPNGQPTAYYATPQTARKVRTADVVVTCILLIVGLISVLIAIGTLSVLPQALSEEYDRYGVTFHQGSNYGALSLFILISHIALWVVALGISILLMVKRRVAFWVPLTAGVIAAVIFWGVIVGMLVSDPALMTAIQSSSQ